MVNLNDKSAAARFFGTVGDRILAAVFLVYFLPVILIVAFLLKFETNGPVFARRSRCMPDYGLVDLWEFRTVLADRGETARTPLGTFLRDSRLDLLPRLVNMLRGEVTFGLLFR